MFAFMGVGPMEMMIVGGIALLLFGKRLPEVARSVGKGIVEFKKGISGIEDSVDEAARRPSASHSRPVPPDDRDDAVAPKFDPPRFEPTDESR